ncbi:MAG: beta-galactosidase [Lentisphaeria bacterium]|nr:beta-galactosidase [Lentisphaeria bacterium]
MIRMSFFLSCSQRIGWLIFVCFPVFLADARGENGNLLKNPGFEEIQPDASPLSWTLFRVSREGVTTQTMLRDDNRVLHVQADDRVTQRIEQSISVDQSGVFELQFKARIIGDAQFYVTWAMENAHGELLPASRNYTRQYGEAHAVDWSPFSHSITVPVEAAKITIRFYFSMIKGGQQGVVYLDDVSFRSQSGLPEGAKLILSEDFSGGKLPDSWKIVRGSWQVIDQALRGEQRAQIIYTVPSGSPNLRLEYTAWSDEPGDLSAFFCRKSYSGKDMESFFGFGCKFNTENKIMAGSETLAAQGGALEIFRNPIQAGVKHKIIVQRQYQKLQMLVDGELILEADDANFSERRGENFGFSIWTSGCFDDIKVYALPNLLKDSADQEQALTFQSYEGFNPREGVATEKFPFTLVGEQSSQRVVDHPTWVYRQPQGNRILSDPCLEFQCGEAGMQVSRELPLLPSGLVEFDFMAEEFSGIRFAVLDQAGTEIVQLLIEKDGRFSTIDQNGRRPLREKILYQRRAFYADFRFLSKRWYTFRLLFTDGLQEIILLNHYTETDDGFAMGKVGEYLPLMVELQSEKFPPGASLVIESQGKGRFLLDNMIIAGPVGRGNTIQGKNKNQNAAKILGLDFPPRKDPFSLKMASYRSLTTAALRQTPLLRQFYGQFKEDSVYQIYRPVAVRYNQALIDLAFLRERIDMLQRSLLYLAKNSASGNALGDLLSELEKSFADAELLQEKVLQCYADSYLNEQRGTGLEKTGCLLDDVILVHQRIRSMLEKGLAVETAESGAEVIACPSANVTGRVVWNPSMKRWEQSGRPTVFHYMSFGPSIEFFWEDLRMLGFQNYRDVGSGYKSFPARPDRDPPLTEEGIYINPDDSNWQWLKTLQGSGRRGLVQVAAGLNYAVTHAPQWWLQKHQDQGIFFSNNHVPSAVAPVWNGLHPLDWWHPEVQKLIDAQFSAVSKQAAEYKEAISILQYGWELTSHLPGGLQPGYSPSALKAFRQRLQDQYGSIDQVNRLWQTNYQYFSEIIPPSGNMPPSGCQYEFRKFVQDGFTSWLSGIRSALHKHLQEVPAAIDSQTTFAEDPVGLFRATDIKLYHTYQAWDRKLVDRWHAQLGAVLETPFGTKEWIISQGTAWMFQMDKIRNRSLCEKSMLMMWGGTMMEFYGWGGGNWQYDLGFHDPRLDRLIFNYIAPIYPIFMERIRRIGSVALTAPLAKPEIGLLEVTSSHYNGCKVRSGMQALATELSESSWDYEFLYEQLLLEKEQNLAGTKVLLVPAGECMPEELFVLIEDWVRSGGILFCTGGPSGILNQYGQDTGRMKSLFGEHWQRPSEGLWEFSGAAPFFQDGGSKAWQWSYGRGLILVYNQMHPDFIQHLSEVTVKPFGSDALELQFCLREDSTAKYLYVLNWSDQQIVTSEIYLRGKYSSVLDLGLQVPLSVPVQHVSGQTRFPCRLAPGEVTLYQIR